MAAKKVTIKPVAKPASAAVKTTAPKTEENKAEVKKVEAPAAAVKAEAKPVEKQEETAKKETVKKAAAKKTTAKKADAKKADTKKASVRKTAKKAELKSEVHIQFANKSYMQEDLIKIAKDVWKYDLKQKVGDLTKVELYVKPEEGKAYYVMNKDFTGSFEI